LFAALCVCVCVCVRVDGILSVSWFSKELKMTYQRTTSFVVSSLYFSFTNQYSLGGGFPFLIMLVPRYKLSNVTHLSNLICMAFRESVCLCVGCVTTWSRGSHHIHSTCISWKMSWNSWTWLIAVLKSTILKYKNLLTMNFFFILASSSLHFLSKASQSVLSL
jgi:hypothetical protein